VRHFVRGTALARLEQVDLARISGQLLEVLTDNGRAQEMLDELLGHMDVWMQGEATQQRIAGIISSELDVLRFDFFRSLAGNWSSKKLVKRLSEVISEVNQDPDHPLRQHFDEQLSELVRKLKQESAFRLRADQLRAQMIGHPALHAYLTGLVDDVVNWFEEDIAQENSELREHLGKGARKLGEALSQDLPMQAWINDQILAMAGPLVERYRSEIGRYIAERIEAWNDEELVEQLESQVGKDLQFIRINGTLVGGLVGVLIHLATELAMRF
jgi:uncharacterized membrane-anchored protein YjiN (DUF445 family)